MTHEQKLPSKQPCKKCNNCSSNKSYCHAYNYFRGHWILIFINTLTAIADKSKNPLDVLRTSSGKPKKRVTEIGFRIKQIGGLWFLKKTTESWLHAFNGFGYGYALYACWNGIVFDDGEISI